MKHHPVTSSNDPHLTFVEKLYHEAFPEKERRDWKKLLALVDSHQNMFLEVFTDEAKSIGFMVYWMFGEWCFIEYLAVDPAMRGLKYGARIVEVRISNTRVLLEVEPPVSPDAIRRISFYERLGLKLLSVPYRQPTYNDPSVFFEMKLMSNLGEWPAEELTWMRKQILAQVYGIK